MRRLKNPIPDRQIELQHANERKTRSPNVPWSKIREVLDHPLGMLLGMKVWRVHSNRVRDLFDTDFTMGSHDAHSAFIPVGEIWVGRTLVPSDLAPLLVHEATERYWMVKKGWSYEKAHDRATVIETIMRQKIHRRGIRIRDESEALELANVLARDFLKRSEARAEKVQQRKVEKG
jgi:hypothetical protein